MPTYEYECEKCNYRFEREQPITAAPLTECPQCGARVHRVITGGSGFIIKGRGGRAMGRSTCSFEQSRRTCCGRDEPCGKPPCE